MSGRLTDEPFPGSPDDMMNTITALRARVAKLEDRCKGYSTSVEANCREIERLEARVAKLEAALTYYDGPLSLDGGGARAALGRAAMSKLLDQADQAAEFARAAFDAGDVATGIAAIQFAAQLVQLARLLDAALKVAPQ